MRKSLRPSLIQLRYSFYNQAQLKRNACSLFVFLFLSMITMQGQSIFITSSGGSFPTERYLSVSTLANGGGTIIWEQGDYCGNSGLGDVTDVEVDVTAYCGQTIYVNAYDKYDDSWNGGLYEIWTAAGQSGTKLAENGGNSPDDTNDDDGSSTPCDIDQATELEVSESFVATACLCTDPTIGTATAVTTNCNMGTFDVSLEVTAAGEGTSVDVTDGTTTQTVMTFPSTVTFTGYAGGTSVTLNADNGSCTVGGVDANVVTESCACTTAPTGTAVVNTTACGTDIFHVDVTVSTIGDAAAVTVSDGTTTDNNSGAGYAAAGTVQMGPYAAGTNVIITLAGLTWTSCSTDLAPVTADCLCTMTPTATVTTGNLDCGTGMYDITVTVDSDGSGDINMSDVYIDGSLAAGGMNVMTGVANSFTVTTGAHTVTIEAEGSTFGSCTSTSYPTDVGCNGGETCVDAVDILGSTSTCDLSSAVNENGSNGGLNPCFETVGNGTTLGMGNCNGAGCFEHSAYYYTDYKDIWYVIDLPDGVDQFSVNFTGLSCHVAVFPYTSTCGSLSLMDVTGGVGTGLADSDNDGTIEEEANQNPFISTDGSIHFKGADVATASTSPIYLRVFGHDNNDNSGGSTCNSGEIGNCSFTIGVTSPQPNDVCGDGLNINSFDEDAINDPDSYLPVTQSGDISQANTDADTHDDVDGTTCNGITFDTGEEDLWYAIRTPDNGSNYHLDVDIDFTGTADEIYVLLHNYCANGDANPIGCESISADGTVSFDASNMTNFDMALTPNNDYNIRIVLPTGSNATTFDISGKLIAENNTCAVMQETFPGFDADPSGGGNAEFNMNFASDSGADPVTAGTDLWFQFDPITETDAFGQTTASTTAEITIGGLDAGEEVTLLLYKGNTVSANNCNDLAGDYLESLTVTGNGVVELSCLDELHLSVHGGYLIRIVQTAGGTIIDEGLINVDPQPAGPYNNDCENIWDASGAKNLGWTDPTPGTSDGVNNGGLAVNFNPYVIEEGDVNYLTGQFENATDCHPDIASALCSGVDHQALATNEDRDAWYIITIPDNTCPTTGLESSSVINSVEFSYTAPQAGYLYIYDGCTDANLLDCSGQLASGAGSTWTASGLTQGQSYLVRVKPHDSGSVNNEFSFDLSWESADPAPCNDDPANAEALSVGCFSYSSLETWSAQGATETAPVAGAPETDVWFSFTAPAANGGSYTTTESWASVFFENVSGHNLFLDIYNTTSTSPTVTTYESGGSAGDQGWGIFGNLDPGATYYLRLYHKELPTVNVQYKIAINDSPVTEPGWSCGSNSQTMINECASGCKDLREVFFKIDLPTDAPTNSYWAIEVTGMDQDLDFELRSQYNNGQTTYVVGATGVDGALEGGAHDYDHPCSSVALESAVTISSTTTGLTGCDGNDSLGDIDPTLTSQGSDGNTAIGSGVRRVYHDMNGPGSATMKDYYFVRVFIDPTDPRYADWAEVKICDISFKGPYSTSALADAGGTPDRNCDAVACDITNVVVSNDNTCNGNDATFTVTFDVAEGGGTYEVYDTDTNLALGSTTTAADAIGVTINVTVTGPTAGSTINVDVRDMATIACNGGVPQSAILATCPNTTVGVDDFNNTPEGLAVTGNALDNDYDPQGDIQSVKIDDPTLLPMPANGTATIDAAGNYTYTPNSGFTGEDSFTYTVCDDQSPVSCDVATVYVEVIPDLVNGNNPPIADPDYGVTYADTPIMGSLVSNDNDPDGDNLVINTTPTSGPTNGILTINPDGTYTYTPNSGFTGMDMFMYEVCDDGSPSMCDITTVTIDIIPDNGTNITSATDDSGVGLINETITGDLVANDTDPDGDNQTISTTPVAGPSVAGATVTINTDGTYSYVPATDYVGNDEFMYEICDDAMPTMACEIATVHITILADKPNLTYGVTDFNHTPVNIAVSGNALSNDSDPEGHNQSVTAVVTMDTPSGNGTYTIDAMGMYTYTPDLDYTGEDSFVYEVCDDGSPVVCQDVTVYIEVIPGVGSNNNNIIANPDYGLTEINTPITGNLTSNDNDPDGDNFAVNTTPETAPTNGTVMIFANGTYIYTPATNFTGTDTFEYEVCDDGTPSSCDITIVTIDVIPDTGNVTSASDDSGVGLKNTSISGDLLDNDTDPEGDSHSINTTPTSMPTNGTVTIYPDGSYDYVPTTDFVGNDEFTYEVCDNGNPIACENATVYLTVLDSKDDAELTVTFSADEFTFSVGESIEGYYTYENIGAGSTTGDVKVLIVFPNTAVATTVFNQMASTTNVGGAGTALQNADWNYQLTPTGVLCTLKPGMSIPSGGFSRIGGLTFTAVGVPFSTARTTTLIVFETGGDINDNNNRAQGSFLIN